MWMVNHDSFATFRRALPNAEGIYVTGYLNGTRRALTLASAIEEREHLCVEGWGGWRAEVWREGGRLKTAPARPRKGSAVQLARARSNSSAAPSGRHEPRERDRW